MKKQFPKRRHKDCPEFCEHCQAWSNRIEDLMRPSTNEALKAFRNVLEAHWPQLEGHEASADIVEELRVRALEYAWDLACGVADPSLVPGARESEFAAAKRKLAEQRILDLREAEEGQA